MGARLVRRGGTRPSLAWLLALLVVSMLALGLYGSYLVKAWPFDRPWTTLLGLFSHPLEGFALEGIGFRAAPEDFARQHPGAALRREGEERIGEFADAESRVVVWFAHDQRTARQRPRKIRIERTLAGAGLEVTLERLAERFGTPASVTCRTPSPGLDRACHVRWWKFDAIIIDAVVSVGPKGPGAAARVALTAQDTTHLANATWRQSSISGSPNGIRP